MNTYRYTLVDYFYALEIPEDLDNLKDAYEYLEENKDISSISEIYGNGESINLADYNHDPNKIDAYFESISINTNYKFASETDEIQIDDYVITQLDYKHTLHEHEGEYLGEFHSLNNAITFMIKRIKENGCYPNIFIQNNRGNIEQIVLEDDLGF